MARHVHLTPLGGMAGDMFVAAMLSACPELEAAVLADIAAVLPPEHPSVALHKGSDGGLVATQFHVPGHPSAAPVHYPQLAAFIDDSSARPITKRIAGALLRSLAEAEAQVHGCSIEDVHFHEIADWDTLADLTAAAAILGEPFGWSLDPLPLGGGTVKTAHGVLPVPAPATSQLLTGLSVHDDGIAGERVTPTGACIARYIALQIGLAPRPRGTMSATGHGAGTRKLQGRPNILVAQVISPDTLGRDEITILECDIDDMTPEEMASAVDSLRDTNGVRDVTTQPVFGKKGRIATRLCLLAEPALAETVADVCFQVTSTIGIRRQENARWLLPRRVSTVGHVRVKTVDRPGGPTTKAESDDLGQATTLAERRRLARDVEDNA